MAALPTTALSKGRSWWGSGTWGSKNLLSGEGQGTRRRRLLVDQRFRKLPGLRKDIIMRHDQVSRATNSWPPCGSAPGPLFPASILSSRVEKFAAPGAALSSSMSCTINSRALASAKTAGSSAARFSMALNGTSIRVGVLRKPSTADCKAATAAGMSSAACSGSLSPPGMGSFRRFLLPFLFTVRGSLLFSLHQF